MRLTANYNTVIQVNNQNPIAELGIEEINAAQRNYRINTAGSDSDGEITLSELTITDPSGVVSSIESLGSIEQHLGVLGTYLIVFKVQDNEGAWSEEVSQEVLIENIAPESSFNIIAINEE
jgi:hypothetical protein